MNYAEICFDKNMAVEKTIHVPSQIVSDDMIADGILNEIFTEYAHIAGAMGISELLIEDFIEEEDVQGLAEFFESSGLKGFLLLVATPVPKFVKGNSAISSISWGLVHTKWVYGETYDEAFIKATEWVDSFVEQRREMFEESQK